MKCDQLKCGYKIYGGCRKCEDCGAEPLILDDNCPTCWNCSHDEGILRWDNETTDISDDIKNDEVKEEEVKPMEIEVKNEK